MQVSYIVPVHNTAPYLRRCVESIEKQGLAADMFEVILVDDGSTDGSLDIARELAKEHGNVSVLTQKNSGVSVARNKGLDAAKGKYIMFVDSDDTLEPDAMQKVIDVAEKYDAQITVFRGMAHGEDGSTQYLDMSVPTNKTVSGSNLVVSGVHFSAVWFAVYRRSLIESTHTRFLGGVTSGEDVDFCMRLYPQASRVMRADILVYHYWQREGSALTTRSVDNMKRRTESNIKVACNILAYTTKGNVENNVKDVYVRQMNSLLVSQFLDILRHRNIYGKPFVRQCVSYARQHGGLPVSGRTESWKSGIARILLNAIL